MIHIVQCLCGPERHAIFAVAYTDDGGCTPENAKQALAEYIEDMVKRKQMRRRCEICDKAIIEFWYEDHVPAEQDWDKLQLELRLREIGQAMVREATIAERKAGKN